MSVAVSRRCRTCPVILENYSDQCVRCSERSKAVRAAVATLDPLPVLRVRKVGGCSTDGHHGCEHFQAIYRYAKTLMEDCAFCPVCAEDAVGDAEIVHKTGCGLFAIVTVAPVDEQRGQG